MNDQSRWFVQMEMPGPLPRFCPKCGNRASRWVEIDGRIRPDCCTDAETVYIGFDEPTQVDRVFIAVWFLVAGFVVGLGLSETIVRWVESLR